MVDRGPIDTLIDVVVDVGEHKIIEKYGKFYSAQEACEKILKIVEKNGAFYLKERHGKLLNFERK